MKPISLRAYARHRRCSPEAVSKAVKAGRLRESVTQVNGRPAIASTDLADEEWERNTQPRDGSTMDELIAVRVRKETAQAELAELDLAERRGELIAAEKVKAKWAAETVAFRTEMLSVHVDCKQEMPELSLEQIAKIEAVVRRKLERLGGGVRRGTRS
jgi:phage terminase Nu1 subunit (DNA packaging protein)